MGAKQAGPLALTVLAVLVAAVAAVPAHAASSTRDLAGGELIGAQIDPITAPAFCAKLREDGSRSVSVFLSRGLIERDDGSLNRAGIDNRVNADISCGLDVAVRVRPTTQPDQDSFLPSGVELDSYLSLLTQLSAYLEGRVTRYAIDNEAAASSHFDGSADDYFTLLRDSAAALRAGDPAVEILDGTMASGNMTAVMVADLYARGRYDDALALTQETQANELGGGAPVTDMASLTAYVDSDRVQRSIQFFQGAVDNQASYDAFQLHYYGPWRSLPSMTDYVRSHGINLPIEIWEVGHRFRDGRPFVEQEHADETARLAITAAGEGSPWTIFTSYLGTAANDDYGLLTFDGTADHQARSYFRTAAHELTGATQATRLSLPGDAWGYRFERPAGQLFAAWSEQPSKWVASKLGLNATTAAVTTSGSSKTRDVRLDGLKLGGTPKFFEPDLLQIDQVGERVMRKRLRLSLECPSASPLGSCRGRLEVRSGSGRVLAASPYRVDRGAAKKLKLHLADGRPRRVTATTKRCPAKGSGRCVSWADIGRVPGTMRSG